MFTISLKEKRSIKNEEFLSIAINGVPFRSMNSFRRC